MSEKGGVALLTILVLVSLIGMMAYTMNRTSGMSSIMEHGNKGNEEAYYIAEAGIQNAIWEIKQNGSWLAGFTNKAFGNGSYTVIATDIGANTTTLVSTGTSGGSKETIQTRVTASSCAPTQTIFAGNDTFIESKKKNKNHNGETKIKVDKNKKRGLFFFDISSISGTSTVQSATLDLYLKKSKKNDTVLIYRVTSEWIDSQATWKKRKTGINWGNQGGDFNSTVEGTLPSSGTGWKQADVTNLVRDWVNGSNPNFGMLLGDNQKSDDFRSNESGPTFAPKLTVDYTPC